MNLKIAWTEYNGTPHELTDNEILWFLENADFANKATGYNIRILPYNFDLLEGKHQNALGICCTEDPKNCLTADTFIMIDTFFIHEKYAEIYNDEYSVDNESLEHVIAHELAHLTAWRHGKKHTAKTEELYAKIINAKEQKALRKGA